MKKTDARKAVVAAQQFRDKWMGELSKGINSGTRVWASLLKSNGDDALAFATAVGNKKLFPEMVRGMVENDCDGKLEWIRRATHVGMLTIEATLSDYEVERAKEALQVIEDDEAAMEGN
jgi:hypothetical protein